MIERCKHCGREKGNHKANTFHCPIGRGNFHAYDNVKTFEPKKRISITLFREKTKSEVKCYKTIKPKFGNQKCIWYDARIFINDNETQIHWDRGMNYYIEFNNIWYKIPFNTGIFLEAKENLTEVESGEKFTIL